MPNAFKYRDAATQIGEHFAGNHDQWDEPFTLAELAEFYGKGKATVRSGLRLAAPSINAESKAITGAERAKGWTMTVSDDHLAVVWSHLDRLRPIITELARLTADEEAVLGDADSVYGGLVAAMEDVVEKILALS